MKIILITLLSFFSSLLFSQTPQETIDHAMQKTLSTESLNPLTENLATLNHTYWVSYNYYLQSIYLMESGEEYTMTVEKAINLLQEVDNKNSEDYALLASLISLKMSTLTSIDDLMNAENFFNQYITTALELDASNPRIYYVAGIYDLYKPSIYGGGKIAEQYLSKSLELYDSYEGEITWGKKHALEMFNNIQDSK